MFAVYANIGLICAKNELLLDPIVSYNKIIFLSLMVGSNKLDCLSMASIVCALPKQSNPDVMKALLNWAQAESN
jgi:hypothetical protein